MGGVPNRPARCDDESLEWVRRFPLRPIRAEADYDEAGRILADLVARADAGLSAAEDDYMEVLSDLVGAYDRRHFPRERSTPLESLKYRMAEHQMKSADLARLLGIGSGHASLIPHGKRGLSKANIRRLGEHFKVGAGLFV